MSPLVRIYCLAVIAIAITVAVSRGSDEKQASAGDQQNVKILFIGNSFTSSYDIPATFEKIAQFKGKKVTIEAALIGGAKFSHHVHNTSTLDLIGHQKWDYIVLQEQSQLASFSREESERQSFVYARWLVKYIHQKAPAAKIVFYETWGYKNGDALNCAYRPQNCNYEGMQTSLNENYRYLASQTGALLSPVGEVWQRVRYSYPEIELYASDAIHPSEIGAYLAASTLFHAVFQEPVAGAPYIGVSDRDGAIIQQEVDHTPTN